MDPEIDPCEDFYEYSCGNWDAVRGFHKYEVVLSNFFVDEMEQVNDKLYDLLNLNTTREDYILNEFPQLANARAFFHSCMHTDLYNQKRVPEYLSFLQLIGGFPAADPNWNERNFNALKMLAYSDIFKGNLLFSTKISQTHPFEPIMSVQKVFGLESRIPLNTNDIEGRNSRNYKSTLQIVNSMLNDYCKENDLSSCGTQKINNISNNFFDFGKKFLDLNFDDVDDEIINSTAEFLDSFPEWEIYFKAKYQVDVTKKSLPLLAVPKKMFAEINNLIQNTDKETLANILSLKVLYTLHVENKYSKFKRDFCLNYLKEQFSFSLANVYVKLYWDSKVESEISAMFEQMKIILIQLIEKSDWLDNSTRLGLLPNIKSLNASLGYIRHPITNKLAEVIDNCTEFTDNYYSNNILSWRLLNQIENYHFLNEVSNTTPTKDVLKPMLINSNYDPFLNSITMYAGIFHKPLYDKRFPKILKYGYIGETIGHELSHAIYNNQYEEEPEWSEIGQELYLNKTTCFKEQYDKFYYPEVNLTVDGFETLSENIADNVGLKLTYLAYIKYLEENGFNCDEHAIDGVPLTNMQLFFVAHAQQYCTTYFRRNFVDDKLDDNNAYPFMMVRANGPVQNSKEFAKAFSCKEGSKMNPKQKCELF